jgi:DnaJ-class molecular chaperone
MAGENGKQSDRSEAAAAHGPRECIPCGGSGRVISNLGGAQSKVQCPWCEGTGTRKAAIDAQAHWHGRPQSAA